MKTAVKASLLFLIFIASAFGMLVCVAALVVLTSPQVEQLKGCMTTSMFQVEVCPASPGYVHLQEHPPHLIDALVVSEDGAFFSHSGFDWYELRESFEKNLEYKSFKRGGSTLTQQLAKNAFLTSEKSIWRKLKEAYLTYKIEATFSKHEILEKYLNIVEFGPGLYGISKASQNYFGKNPKDLHLLESAFLVMLLPNPKKYSQSYREGRLTEFARKRIGLILYRLVKYGKISEATYSFAKDNIAQFPWFHLAPSDFEFSLPDLPEEITGDFPTEPTIPDEAAIEKEIREYSEEQLEEIGTATEVIEPDAQE